MPERMSARMQRHRLPLLLALGHLSTDINQGALPTLLPWFIAKYQLSYAAAAVFVTSMSIASSVVQPLFGYLADRFSRWWLLPLGVLVAGAGAACSGVLREYWLSVLSVAISGIGVAAFHPEAAHAVNRAAGEKKATGMSIFGVGGQLGFTLGPLIATGLTALWGVEGTLGLLVPAVGMTLVLAHQFRKPGSSLTSGSTVGPTQPFGRPRNAWFPFWLLSVVVVCRSILFYGLNTFIPLYWIHVLGQSKAAGGAALSVLMATGVLGNLTGGRMADRHGYKAVILGAFVLLLPLLFLLALSRGVTGATLLLVPLGFALHAPYGATVVLGQRYLPNHVGLASGVTLGLAVAVGGIAAPIFGYLADRNGIPAALLTMAFLPVIGLLLTLPLPRPR